LEKTFFGPCTLVRTWGTRPKTIGCGWETKVVEVLGENAGQKKPG
jgi:hypothetical protein